MTAPDTQPAPASYYCPDCEHTHTPDGCTGPPSPSDRWAGVTPSACDCDTAAPASGEGEALREAVRNLLRTAARPSLHSATAQVNAAALDRLRAALGGEQAGDGGREGK